MYCIPIFTNFLKKTFFIIIPLFTLAVPTICNAQNFHQSPSGIKASVNGVSIELQFYNPEIVRVIKVPEGKIFIKESLSVVKKPQHVSIHTDQKGDLLILRTEKLNISLNLKSGELNYMTTNGIILLKEKQKGTKFTPFDDAGNKTYTVSQAFLLDRDEPIYGLGQHQRGNLNQRNHSYINMIQGNTEDVVPIFQSVKGYGVFWDNYSPTSFEDKADETSFRSDVGDGIDYYFMYGGNADGVVADMRELTGQAPMFPLWTFGYWQSKERYKGQDELVGVVKKYRELKVPLDGIIQDWQYWGNNYLWNAMDFLNADYSDPKKMVNEVHGLNAHMIISIWASFGPQTLPYKEMKAKNMLLDFSTWPESGLEKWPPNLDYPSGVRPYDAYNPEARDIYWKYMNKGLFATGLDGWWMDSTEPDHLHFKPSDLDLKTYLGSFRKVRNAFPLMTVGGVYQHQRAANSDKRVFILTRSAFAGQQRYGANTWSGDVTSSWQALSQQIPTGLNFSLSGIPYWNSDIGGFFLSKFSRKLADPDYRELYTRWIEFGTFCPMMRSHGADAPREIYQFGNKGDRIYDVIDKFINLRYRLLPYIYSVSRDVTAHQSSMMRALMMDFVTDRDAWDINDEYMFGKSLLVSPVTNPMYTKRGAVEGRDTLKVEDFGIVKTKQTYLPKGTNWYDFWTGEKFAGGQKVTRQTPLDIIPLYVKAGSIMPFGPDVQYATEKNWGELEIRIYPGNDVDFTLYEDENDNYDYEKGQYSEIKFHWNDRKHTLTIANRIGSFNGMITNRKFNISVTPSPGDHAAAPKTIKSVGYNGNELSINF